MVKDRFEWVDTFRFLGIFAIYLGHLGSIAGHAYHFVFLYHVQVFFFAAGFFANYKQEFGIILFISDKFKRLMLPYFAFALISVSITAFNSNFDVTQYVKSIEYVLLGVRNTPFVGSIWFINCIFVIYIIDYIACLILRNKYMVLAIAIAAHLATQFAFPKNPLIDPSWIMNADSAIAYWWLMATGRVMFQQVNKEYIFKSKTITIVLITIVSTISVVTFLNSQSFFLWYMYNFFPHVLLTNLFGVLSSGVLTLIIILFNVYLAKFLSQFDLLNKIGRNTLNICGFELLIKTSIPSIISIFGLTLTISSPLAAVIYTFVCVISCHYFTKYLSINLRSVFLIK